MHPQKTVGKGYGLSIYCPSKDYIASSDQTLAQETDGLLAESQAQMTITQMIQTYRRRLRPIH